MIINLEKFIKTESVYWDRLNDYMERIESNPETKLSYKEISEFYYLYKRAVSGLSKVRTFSLESTKIDELNFLVSRAFSFLHSSNKSAKIKSPGEWIFKDMPKSFQRHKNKFLFATLVMLFGAIFGGGIILFDYTSKKFVMPFSHLIGKPSDRVKKEMESKGKNISSQRSTFAAFLMTHNIKVSIACLALGLTFGLGTIIMLFYNGVILGAVIMDYIIDDQTVFLMGWLLPHGVIEIPAILIAGQIGFILATSQIKYLKHKNVLDKSSKDRADIVNLFFCLFFMLIWAGIIEAFMSQYHEPVLKYEYKILFGLIELIILILFLNGSITKLFLYFKNKGENTTS